MNYGHNNCHQPWDLRRCHKDHLLQANQVANRALSISLIKSREWELEQSIQKFPLAQKDSSQKQGGHKLHRQWQEFSAFLLFQQSNRNTRLSS